MGRLSSTATSGGRRRLVLSDALLLDVANHFVFAETESAAEIRFDRARCLPLIEIEVPWVGVKT